MQRYEAITNGINVSVLPAFLEEESSPAEDRYVWLYHIEIENFSTKKVKLLTRRWEIIDSSGYVDIVDGEGVVGQKPTIEPDQSYEYASAVPLRTPSGMMRGVFRMITEDKKQLIVKIPPFSLDSPFDMAVAN
ncbi:MAG: Co2+/Mg2+ efflux protein ApaG [Alphaproteobacteria bacterium]